MRCHGERREKEAERHSRRDETDVFLSRSSLFLNSLLTLLDVVFLLGHMTGRRALNCGLRYSYNNNLCNIYESQCVTDPEYTFYVIVPNSLHRPIVTGAHAVSLPP